MEDDTVLAKSEKQKLEDRIRELTRKALEIAMEGDESNRRLPKEQADEVNRLLAEASQIRFELGRIEGREQMRAAIKDVSRNL